MICLGKFYMLFFHPAIFFDLAGLVKNFNYFLYVLPSIWLLAEFAEITFVYFW